MGIFSTLFGKKKDLNMTSGTQLLNIFTPYFARETNPKLNDTFMSCVNTHATHLSKIKPKVYLKDKEDKKWLTYILSVSPNPVMEAGAFWEKVARNYYTENNAFIYLDWDLTRPKEPLRSLWVLDPLGIEVSIKGEDILLKFNIQEKTVVTSIENIIHVARNVDASEIFGEKSRAINKVFSVIATNFQGIENAIKSSAFIRFLVQSPTPLTDEVKKEKAKYFAETYLGKDSSGVAYVDSAQQVVKVDSQAKYANADEMKVFEEKIRHYMNMNTAILSADFTEVQWQAYSETNIEPFCNKLMNELTRKIFTEREIGFGNRIVVASHNLEVVSLTTKNNLILATKELGLFTINEYRHLINLGPIEGGDKRLTSLNYVNADKQDDYQGVDDDETDIKGNEEGEENPNE